MLAMIARWLRAGSVEIERRATIRTLLALDDRTLDDIGYTRGMLAAALEDPELMSFAEIRRRSKRDLEAPAARPRPIRSGAGSRARLCSGQAV